MRPNRRCESYPNRFFIFIVMWPLIGATILNATIRKRWLLFGALKSVIVKRAQNINPTEYSAALKNIKNTWDRLLFRKLIFNVATFNDRSHLSIFCF